MFSSDFVTRPKSESPSFPQQSSRLFFSSVPEYAAPPVSANAVPQTELRPDSPKLPSSLDVLGLDMRDLVRKVQHLSHLGIEDNRIALPKICVVGDQSTGKSSLIEGISEIRVPRSAGTCTRCPMEIVLRESEPDQQWKCVISLVHGYHYDPQRMLKNRVPKTEKPDYLGPWLRQGAQDEEEFITLIDRNQVEDAIRWAQLAILNPQSDSQDYVPGKNTGTSTAMDVKFSPNVIRLDMTAPNLPNLSFYDLPGVINQADNENEKYVVSLVSKLVKQYVSQENCIVLLTQSMTDDASNSTAARIVREVKGAKERTLGVLTKPDRLSGDNESHQQWIEILDGSKFQFGQGWYVVKNNPDPKVPHHIARAQEEDFFGNAFWAGTLAMFQDRFGVRKLQAALQTILMAQIQKCLPSIIKQIDDKAGRIDNELKTLPDPPVENYQFILIEKVVKLGLCFNGLFGDGSESKSLQKPWNDLVLDLQKALDKTRPRLILGHDSDYDFFREAIDSDCEIVSGPFHRGTKRKIQHPEPNIKSEPNQPPQPVQPTRPTQPSLPEKGCYVTGYFHKLEPIHRFKLDEIREIKQECQLSGVPNQIDPRAIQKLNRESVKHWKGIVKEFADALYDTVKQVVQKTLNEVMAMYHQTELFRELQRITDDFLSLARLDYEKQVIDYFCMEYNTPFTMAHQYHKEKSLKALQELTQKRHEGRRKVWLRLHGYSEDKKEKAPEFGPDPFSQEIEMLASSRGYYEIAKVRFTDMICLLAESHIRGRCRNELKGTLEQKLKATTPERCCELMAEDPEREARRHNLAKQKKKLAEAQKWLATVHNVDEDEEMKSPSEVTMDGRDQTIDWA
ncbi:dynamin GTPase [Penicillium angulare]|uniref:Dynamin GTPase n=1 Tax=Penicillium angulare TaxID=116970 RepID=A0A9W9F597_9EURO|nr:dynamin GTPase [Penicillium angulare]